MSDIDYDSSPCDSDGGAHYIGGTGTLGASVPTSGPIGQQIGQKIAGSGSTSPSTPNWPYGSTSTGNGSTVTSTGNGAYANKTTAPTAAITWNKINSLAKPQPFTKTKVRYVIAQADGTTLELKEQATITPQEMIGISKFLGLVSTYTVLILGQAVISYNFNIKWSEIISNLGITKHFVPGLALDQYDNDNSEVLDVLLHDPQ